MHLALRPIQQDCKRYLVKQLEAGHHLSRAILRRGLSGGRCFAILPDDLADVPSDFYRSLEHPGLTSSDVVSFLADLLRQEHKGLLMAEHPFATASDGWLKVTDTKYATCEGRVYLLEVAGSGEIDAQSFSLTIGRAAAYPSISILVRRLAPPPSRGIVDRGWIENAANGAGSLIIGAFDEETRIVWRWDGA
jgi:hypothetical protein